MIEGIKALIKEKKEELRELEDALYRLLLKKRNITLGMLVRDKKGRVFRVTSAKYLEDFAKPWVRGDIRKKDGTFGMSHEVYSDWERVEEKEENNATTTQS